MRSLAGRRWRRRVKVLVAEPLDAGAIARLTGAGHEVIERQGLQGEALVAALAGCRGLVVRGGTRVTGDVLRAATSVRVVVRAARVSTTWI